MSRLLLLGGTAWLGRRVAEVARDAGHDVTCLARGESGPAPDGVRLVRADRDTASAYDELSGTWDAAIEVSWQPEHVRGAVAALGDRVDHWVYVSSISVYVDPGSGDEVHEAWPGEGEAGDDDYGPAKVACEEAVLAAGADRAMVVRAGLIGGYGDPSDRFGYWPARIARADDGEQVLTPALDRTFQVIDVDDLAAFLVHAGVGRVAGVVDAVGDTQILRALLDACASSVATTPELVAVPDEVLVGHGINPWAGPGSLPLWIPAIAGVDLARANAAAKDAGLVVRPFAETVRVTLQWEREQGLDRTRRSGLDATTERRVLDSAW